MKTKLTILIVLLSLSGIAAAQSTEVSIGDEVAQPGGTVVVPIMINNIVDVGSAQINLIYDANVVHVLSVTDGNFDSTVGNPNNTTGVTVIAAFQMTNPGLSGNITLANITLQAVGAGGEVSPLNLSIITLSTATTPLRVIEATTVNGTFTITRDENREISSVPAFTLTGIFLLIGLLAVVAIVMMGRKQW